MIFFIDSNAEKVYNINNINFVNGFNTGYAGGYLIPGGGAICSAAIESALNVNGCNFNNNLATDSHGGAVYADTINLNGCNFQSNQAYMEGGAVFMSGGSVTNCIFENNHVTSPDSSGGAIYAGNYRACSVTQSRFIGNSAVLSGGAVAVIYSDDGFGYYSPISLSDNYFEKNTAKEYGGAVYISGTMDMTMNVEIRNSNFIENSVAAGEDEGQGGAIYGDAFVDIDRCDFTNNEADHAGSIFMAKSITNCNFQSNSNGYFVFVGSDDMIGNTVTLKNNRMTADNKFDILIDGYSNLLFNINLVFANTLAVPESTVELCRFLDDDGNKLSFGPFSHPLIHAKFTNRDTHATSDATLDEEFDAYYYTCSLAEGVYDVTGLPDELSKCIVKAGVLVVDGDTNYTLTACDVTKYYHGPERFSVTLTNSKKRLIPGVNVEITVNGQTYNRMTDSNGVASMAVNLNSGTYPVTCKCGNAEASATVTVLKTVSGNDITKIFRNGTQYYATFIDTQGKPLKSTDVEFNINGVFYTRKTNENGVARMNINLNPGKYTITARNPSSGEQYTNTITVLTNFLEHSDLTKYYKNDSQYRIRILADDGSIAKSGVKVTFNINGVFYERYSDDDGYVKMNINLEPGEYTITSDYNGLRASNKITVKSVIKSDDLTMSYRDGSRFNATILDGQGKPYANQNVTFNINGVFYEKITDENGVASLAINLMAGEYIITSSYNGMNASNKVTVSS